MLRLVLALCFTLVFSTLPLLGAPKKKSQAATPETPGATAVAASVQGWLDWRGPAHNGTSPETGLPDKADAKAPLWTADFPGQSTPVIADGRLYINGYVGDGPELREGITCFDTETGAQIWQHLWSDYLSDTIYLRYSTSSPAIDGETGNVYVQGTNGPLMCFTRDGKPLWHHSMMEEFGRLTFPNSRTATPIIDGELVIVRGITSAWGAYGPAGDRFYAFDKLTGELVWSSAPGQRPQDNTFSHPLLTWLDGKRVLFSAGGDSTIICINARNGDPIFRFPAAKAGAKGGINAGVLRYKDSLLVIHESENIDTSEVGRSSAYKIPMGSKAPAPGMPQEYETKPLELWRNPLGNLASSPCLVGNLMYEVTGVGELACVDADKGTIVWRKKLAPEQRQSSPLYADGKLYVAMYIGAAAAAGSVDQHEGGDGELYILKPGKTDAEILSRTTLNGRCYGSPIAYNGKIFVQTDRKLYCFGKAGNNPAVQEVHKAWEKVEWPKAGPAARLQIIPTEVLLAPGESQSVRVRSLDANGFTVDPAVDVSKVKFASYIPPTALVKASMNGAFEGGKIVAADSAIPSAGAFQGTLDTEAGPIAGVMRGRVLTAIPAKFDFEGVPLSETTGPGIGQQPNVAATAQLNSTNTNVVEAPTPFAYPPLAWNGARFRFEIRKAPGDGDNLALCKTIDNKLFQRAQMFFGHPDASGYTIEADVMSEGNRRKGCDVGVICQRYQVVIKWNEQKLEVNSNQERLKEAVPCVVERNIWYKLKARVDRNEDGSGVVRAKVWKKTDAEPEAWNIEVKHRFAHAEGAPGLFCMSPQEQRAWIDNVSVTPSK